MSIIQLRRSLGASPSRWLLAVLVLAGCGGEPVAAPLPPPPPAAPGRLVMVTQPVGTQSGGPLSVQPVVQLLDLNGYPSTAVVSVTATINGGGRLDGPGAFTVPTVGGYASFQNLHVTGAGSFTMAFTPSAGNPAVSAPFTVLPSPAAALFAINAPVEGTSGELLATSLVAVRDAAGGHVAGSAHQVMASIASGPGTLAGTVTVEAVGGYARFTDLKIIGTGAHVIRFAAAGLSPAVSPTVRMVGPPVSALSGDDGPMIVGVGVSFVPRPTIRDADSTIISPGLVTISRDTSVARLIAGAVVIGAGGGTTVVVTSPVAAPSVSDSLLVGVMGPGISALYATPGRFKVKTDTVLTLRVIVNTTWIFTSLGRGRVELHFDPAQFSFVSAGAGEEPSVAFDASRAPAGLVALTFTETSGYDQIRELAQIQLRSNGQAGRAGLLRLHATELTARDGRDLRPMLLQVTQPVVLR